MESPNLVFVHISISGQQRQVLVRQLRTTFVSHPQWAPWTIFLQEAQLKTTTNPATLSCSRHFSSVLDVTFVSMWTFSSNKSFYTTSSNPPPQKNENKNMLLSPEFSFSGVTPKKIWYHLGIFPKWQAPQPSLGNFHCFYHYILVILCDLKVF